MAAPPEKVFGVLVCPDDYPRWWPQVREVTRTGPDAGVCRFRSVLPFELRVGVTEARRDEEARVLDLALTGDLDGRLRWTVTPRGPGARVAWEQDTALRKPVLRRLTRPLGPLFAANHALMMRAGLRGLRAWLGVHLDDG
nr:SRPBCC family protein [Streptomyces sp. SBT349]